MSSAHVSARELIASVVDPGSFVSWDTPPDRTGVDEAYAPPSSSTSDLA